MTEAHFRGLKFLRGFEREIHQPSSSEHNSRFPPPKSPAFSLESFVALHRSWKLSLYVLALQYAVWRYSCVHLPGLLESENQVETWAFMKLLDEIESDPPPWVWRVVQESLTRSL